MKKIIDTHAHLYARHFKDDQAAVIQRAKDVLEAVYLPNISLDSVDDMHQLVDQDPDFFFPMMGLHPSDVKEDFEAVLAKTKTYLDDPAYTYVAIGETGIDLYWPENKDRQELQEASLQIQIDWAKEYKLPIILHARDAIDEVADLIEKNLDSDLKGIFHCWDGSMEQAERVISFGSFKMGIGGNVTYRKSVQALLREFDLQYVVLETDSPYLVPEPYRKQKQRRNESSYTTLVAEKIAELQGKSFDEVAEITNANARWVFS
ncbi:MAG: TatD family hydrolase [Bacteroidota bacterium]